MSYEYDDYPDEIIEEAINHDELMSVIKGKYKDYVTELKEKCEAKDVEISANNSLITEKYKKVRELTSRVAELEKEREAYKKAIEDRTLQQWLRNISKPVFGIVTKYSQQPKCSKCDDNRNVVFTDSDGRKLLGRCSCDETIASYEIYQSSVVEVNIIGNTVSLVDQQEIGDRREWVSLKPITSEDEFNKAGYHPLFISKEIAEKYIQYLIDKDKKRREAR